MSVQKALTFYNSKKYSLALREFKSELQTLKSQENASNHTISTVISNIAMVESKLEIFRRSLQSLEEAISYDKSNLQAYLIKHEIFLKLGDTDQAVAVLQDALSIHQSVDFTTLIAIQEKYEQLVKPPISTKEPIKKPIKEPIESKTKPLSNPSQTSKKVSPPPQKLKRKDESRSYEWTAPGYKKKSFYPGGMDRFTRFHGSDDDSDDEKKKKNPIQIQMKDGPMINLNNDEVEQFEIFKAHNLVNEGNLSEALDIYKSIIDDKDTKQQFKWDAILGRGTCYALSGKLDQAYKEFSTIIDADYKHCDALKRRAKVSMALGRVDKAEEDLLQAKKYLDDKLDSDLNRDFALLKQKKGKLNEALAHLDIALKTIEKAESDEDEKKKLSVGAKDSILICKATVYSQMGNYKESEKLATQALVTLPKSREANENLAKAYRDKQEFDKADEYFNKAIDLDSKYISNYDSLGLMRYWRGDTNGTINICKKGIKIQNDNSDFIYLQGASYHNMGQFKEALIYYEKLHKLEPNHWVYYHIDMANFQQNMFDVKLWTWNLDRHFQKEYKEKFSKRIESAKLSAGYKKQTKLDPNAVPLNLTTSMEPILLKIYDATVPYQSKLQYKCPGFPINKKQHRQAGIAIVHMAQKVREFWKSKGELVVDGLSQSVGGYQIPNPHKMGWRDFFDISVAWRQMSEPVDPVWWIDMLGDETFKEGFGSHTPIVIGDAQVVRYYTFHDRVLNLMKELLPQQRVVSVNQQDKINYSKSVKKLHNIIKQDFYVHTNVPRLTDPKTAPLEGTRITIREEKEQALELSIRTPCTPERWQDYDEEMQLAWNNLTNIALMTKAQTMDKDELVRAILTLAYYWYNFMPLTRGTAACGLVSIHALFLAAGLEVRKKLPDNFQVDWEAILNPSPNSFISSLDPWLKDNVRGIEDTILDSIPSIEDNVNTFRKAFRILNAGVKYPI